MDIQSGSFRDVHASVLRQHAELRARLRGLDGAGAPDSSPLSEAYQRISLLRLAVLFEEHLQFEETELAPRIREIDAWGPEREAALLAEHVEQRTRLQRACIAAEDPDAGGLELAHSISLLVVNMLEDMAREEHELAGLVELDSDCGPCSTDQMTG
jgi:hypothetical protein